MFDCDMCGECCRHIGGIEALKAFDNGFGVCVYLNENKCSIYDKRPLLCRVDDCYELFFKNYMDKETYYEQNQRICQQLKEKGDK